MKVMELKINSAKVVDTSWIKSKKYMGKNPNDLGHHTLNKNGDNVPKNNDVNNPIHVNHISNMLHVLLGCRPVSYNSKYRTRNSYIDDIAKNGLIKYENTYSIESINKEGVSEKIILSSFTQGKKPFNDSHRQTKTYASNGDVYQSTIDWNMLYKATLGGNDMCKYNQIYILLRDFGKSIGINDIKREMTLIDTLLMLKDYDEYKRQICDVNIGWVNDIINGFNKKNTFNYINKRNNLAALGNVNDVIKMININATVILYLNDEDAKNILNGKRIARLLDGGVVSINNKPKHINELRNVSIENIENDIEEYLMDGFIKINSLPYTNYEN